jgi:hypothetical protein
MTEYEIEMINIIRNSKEPEKVADYFFNLFLSYLNTNVPSQEKPVDVPQVSV